MTKTIVLSDAQQTLLAALYAADVKVAEIFCGNLMWQAELQAHSPIPQIISSLKVKEFSFEEFAKAIGTNRFKVEWAIREFCPNYVHILDK